MVTFIKGPENFVINDLINYSASKTAKSKGKFCTECGNKILPKNKFCANCGAKI